MRRTKINDDNVYELLPSMRATATRVGAHRPQRVGPIGPNHDDECDDHNGDGDGESGLLVDMMITTTATTKTACGEQRRARQSARVATANQVTKKDERGNPR